MNKDIEINQVIKFYKIALEDYKKVYKLIAKSNTRKQVRSFLMYYCMHAGLCFYFTHKLDKYPEMKVKTNNVFINLFFVGLWQGYYQSDIRSYRVYISPTAENHDFDKHNSLKSLQTRIDFLKNEIIRLNDIKKQGYTHLALTSWNHF